MKHTKLILLAFIFNFSLSINAQTTGRKVSAQSSPVNNQAEKSSPAYAEILLQKTELESQLEDLLVGFTDDFPKVKQLRFQIGLLQRQTDRILAVGSANTNKLTLALGKLIVRKTELDTELWSLKAQYNDDFPEVKRAKRKVEVFEKAIGEILP
ncbi:MAG: hypothetical protein M3525_10710 [Acidobacteriota bacterium]|nr:hypothetical protein [Acidobacteriota bacterium]